MFNLQRVSERSSVNGCEDLDLFHHLYFIISSKESENLEEILLCAGDKAENRYWMPVIFEPSSSTEIKTGMTLKSLHGLRNTS